MIKEPIIFLAGAVIGTLGGCVVSKKRYEALMNAEVASVKSAFQAHLRELYEKSDEKVEEQLVQSLEEQRHEMSVAKDADENDLTDYTKYSKKPKEVDPAEEEHPEDDEEEDEHYIPTEEEQEYLDGKALNEEAKKDSEPKLIKAEDFGEIYETADLYYYTDDDVLANEAEEKLDELYGGEAYFVGDCLEKFDFKNDDRQKTVYVRNFRLGVDYAVTKIWGSYIDICT